MELTRLKWGAVAIGEVIGRTPKEVYYLAKYLKSIRRVGRLLVADPDALLAEVAGTPPQESDGSITARKIGAA
jgi:hypothetical protein